jgi:hypothetical protein
VILVPDDHRIMHGMIIMMFMMIMVVAVVVVVAVVLVCRGGRVLYIRWSWYCAVTVTVTVTVTAKVARLLYLYCSSFRDSLL